MLRPALLAFAGASLLLAAGCRTVVGGTCHKPQAYESATELPPLRVPVGLEGPNTEESMEIPALTEPEQRLDPEGPCLDAPPAITAPQLPPSGILAPRPGQVQRRQREGQEQPATETQPEVETEGESTEGRPRRRPSRPR